MFIDNIVDALLEVLNIRQGYVPRKILIDGIKNVVKTKNIFSFSKLFQTFENMLEEERQKDKSDKTRISAICRMLERLMPYENLASIYVKRPEKLQINRQPVTVLQLSDYSDTKKGAISNFFISLIWKDVQHIKQKKYFDIILLDEFQKIKISEDSSILQILREGRKFDFDAILLSQFVGNYDSDILSALM